MEKQIINIIFHVIFCEEFLIFHMYVAATIYTQTAFACGN